MRIRTATILRLRDALLESGRRPSAVISSAYETLARAGLLTPEEAHAVARVEPLAEVMFLMMAADGEYGDAERDAIRGAVRGLTDNQLHSGTIDVMLEQFAARVSQQGRLRRLQEIASELAEHRSDAESAFVLAAAVAVADDHVADEENAFLNLLAQWLQVSPARASELLDELGEDPG